MNIKKPQDKGNFLSIRRDSNLGTPGYEFSCCFRLISRTISPFEPTFRIMVLKCSADYDGIDYLSKSIPFSFLVEDFIDHYLC